MSRFPVYLPVLCIAALALSAAASYADGAQKKDDSALPPWVKPGAIFVVMNPGTSTGVDNASNASVQFFAIGVDAGNKIFICDSDTNMSTGSANRLQCNDKTPLEEFDAKDLFNSKSHPLLKVIGKLIEETTMDASAALNSGAAAGQAVVSNTAPNRSTVTDVLNTNRLMNVLKHPEKGATEQCGIYIFNPKTNNFTELYNSFMQSVGNLVDKASDAQDRARSFADQMRQSPTTCAANAANCDTRQYALAKFTDILTLNAQNFQTEQGCGSATPTEQAGAGDKSVTQSSGLKPGGDPASTVADAAPQPGTPGQTAQPGAPAQGGAADTAGGQQNAAQPIVPH